MRILIIDDPGSGVNWAMRCMNDGHDVKIYITQKEKTKYIGRGLVDIVENWRDYMRWAELVFLTDNTKYMKEIDRWRRDEGINVVGPTDESSDWELERDVGQKILAKNGIKTIPSKTFTDYDQAIAYVKKQDKRFVSKPSGDADKALSYVSKSPADMVFMLERWKKNGKLKAAPFILQEFIGGVEMAVGGWIGPHGFNHGWFENFEHKKLMNDDLGPNTGEMATVGRYVSVSKLASKMLKPVEKDLIKSGHTGYVDVSVIIDEKGNPWPLEFTMRPGWPTFNLQQELHEGDHAQWLLDLSKGTDAENFILDEVATCVVMAIPDHPYSHITRKEVVGIPLYGTTKSLMDHIAPCEMMMGEAPHNSPDGVKNKKCLVTAGDYVLVVTGSGGTVKSSSKAAYRVLDKLEMPNSPFFRTDAGKRLKSELPLIQPHGYSRGLVYQ